MQWMEAAVTWLGSLAAALLPRRPGGLLPLRPGGVSALSLHYTWCEKWDGLPSVCPV